VGKAEFEYRRVGKALADVHVRRPRGDEADPVIATRFGDVECGSLGFGAQSAFAVEHQRQPPASGTRHHHPTADVLGETGHRARAALAHAHQALDVTDAGRQPEDYRRLEALRQFEGGEREVMRFLRIGRFEHGHMREATPVARILLVLRRREADVVGNGDHQTAGDAGQRHRHQRVGRDVHADVLHGAETPRSGHRGAESDFERDFLVDRPLGVDIRIGGDAFEHLGGRRSRIGRRHAYARFPDGTRDRLVTGHQKPAPGGHGLARYLCWCRHRFSLRTKKCQTKPGP
jgi:hypothetical protein